MKINANHKFNIYNLDCPILISTVGQAAEHAALRERKSLDRFPSFACSAPPAFLLRPAPPPGSHFFCAPRPLRPRAPANPGHVGCLGRDHCRAPITGSGFATLSWTRQAARRWYRAKSIYIPTFTGTRKGLYTVVASLVNITAVRWDRGLSAVPRHPSAALDAKTAGG